MSALPSHPAVKTEPGTTSYPIHPSTEHPALDEMSPSRSQPAEGVRSSAAGTGSESF